MIALLGPDCLLCLEIHTLQFTVLVVRGDTTDQTNHMEGVYEQVQEILSSSFCCNDSGLEFCVCCCVACAEDREEALLFRLSKLLHCYSFIV